MERRRYALFTVLPAIGHINPLLQQAKELRRRGWRVALATTDEMRAHVERTAPDVPFVGRKCSGAMHEPAFRESIPDIQASFRRAGGIAKAADLIEAFAASS